MTGGVPKQLGHVYRLVLTLLKSLVEPPCQVRAILIDLKCPDYLLNRFGFTPLGRYPEGVGGGAAPSFCPSTKNPARRRDSSRGRTPQ